MWVTSTFGRLVCDILIGIDDGSMNLKHREEAVHKIKTSSRTKIILISFKAGNLGKSHIARGAGKVYLIFTQV